MALSQLEPSQLWQHFQTLCDTPRVSKHESALIEKIINWADQRKIEWHQDEVGNLLLRKPSSKGMEDSVPVVMQSHLDMVAQKTDESSHNFLTDPILPVIDDGWLKATGTTLGADNGIGVAAILAVFESETLEHGPLEAVLTVDEEAGMSGASGLTPDWSKSSVLLNLDTEEEGELYVGCSGGVDVNAQFPLEMEVSDETLVPYKMTIRGLKGGHSGIDIHKPQANAIQLLARLLEDSLTSSARICELEAGTLRNALCRFAEATVLVSRENVQPWLNRCNALIKLLTDEYGNTEPMLDISITPTTMQPKMWTVAFAQRVVASLLACPHGVRRMSDQFTGVVETSNNLAVVRQSEWYVDIQCLARSMMDAGLADQAVAIRSVFELAGAKVSEDNQYPGWISDLDAPLLKLMQGVHKECFGSEAKVQVIHAGLECGLLGAAYPNWKMISFGPTIRRAHSPDEKVSIESVQRFWTYLCASLKMLSTVKNI